jgi:hypothetical protein
MGKIILPPGTARVKRPVVECMLDFVEQPLLLAAVGIIGGVVGLISTLFWIVPVLCIVGAFHRAKVVEGRPKKWQVIAYLMVVALSSAGAYGINHEIKENLHIPSATEIAEAVSARLMQSGTRQTQTASTPNSFGVPTLRQFFESDWPALPSYYMVSEIRSSASPSMAVPFAWRLNGDFEARSKFLMILLDDKLPPNEAAFVCRMIAERYEFFVNESVEKIDISGLAPGDTSRTHLKDMVFSKRIFVYYDNPDFTLPEKGEIQSYYEQRGLSVQFRDTAYIESHRDDHLVPPSEPLVPNAVILPNAKDVAGLEISVNNLGADKLTLTTRKPALILGPH